MSGSLVHSSPPITLSINPTYLCNFRCAFCYLTPSQLSDRRLLDLATLRLRLQELKQAGYWIEHVDLYGGEIGLLPEAYLRELDELLEHFDNPSIGVNTNLSKVHPYFLEPHVNLSVSFDFEARQASDRVLQNLIGLGRNVAILMLASPELMKRDVDSMIRTFNSIRNIESVEIKPYSQNQANQLISGFTEFEHFVQKWIESPVAMRFGFTNLRLIQESLSKTRNAFSDDHLYITPTGSFAVLDFDAADREFFLELADLKAYDAWAAREKQSVQGNAVCRSCSYLGSCLTEHYRSVAPADPSCSGFRNLLDWYRDRAP
jgi:hypothetical protein